MSRVERSAGEGPSDQADFGATTDRLRALIDNIERVVFGKTDAVTLCAVGLLAEGHVLLEDVPGTGKTTLARALARSVDAEFRRVQFTSDLLPGDVLGVTVWSRREERFLFQKGPIFGNVVLADELNRTTPRTQSALLEAMNERSVTVDGVRRDLPSPFLVVATQNPLEFEGTYPLPESQLDRFLLRIRIGYPSRDTEREVLLSRMDSDPLEELEPVLSLDELREAVRAVQRVRVDDSLVEYMLDIVEATRAEGRFLLGASPRATLGWLRAARALALISGRNWCVPDDVKRLALPVLGHRVVPTPGASGTQSGDAEESLEALLDSVPVPA